MLHNHILTNYCTQYINYVTDNGYYGDTLFSCSCLKDPVGVQHEVSPLCVLDFYVHESRQRCGYGKVLFEAMLKVRFTFILHINCYYIQTR